jgi:hypothetical protein
MGHSISIQEAQGNPRMPKDAHGRPRTPKDDQGRPRTTKDAESSRQLVLVVYHS